MGVSQMNSTVITVTVGSVSVTESDEQQVITVTVGSVSVTVNQMNSTVITATVGSVSIQSAVTTSKETCSVRFHILLSFVFIFQ
jgi:hypothetical protein